MRNRSFVVTAIVTSAFALLPAAALAHAGMGQISGFAAGFAHPFGGADHLLAMFAVGLWAAQMGGSRRWLAPAAFLVAMLIGALLAMAGLAMPSPEHGIVASLLVLGLLIAGAVRLAPLPVVVLVGLCALFHGHVHGAEMLPRLDALGHWAGFVMATAMLHAAGIFAGYGLRRADAPGAARLAGGVLVVAGTLLAAV